MSGVRCDFGCQAQARQRPTGRNCMDLYFSPLAGSLAARIALYEAGIEARFIEVDPKTIG